MQSTRPTKLFLLLSTMSLALIAPVTFAADYYVATNGDDNNAGTLAAPYASITKALESVVAGDNIYLRGGRYHESVNLVGIHGAAGRPVTITRYANETVTMDGTTALTTIALSDKWTHHSGNIFKIKLRQHSYRGNV